MTPENFFWPGHQRPRRPSGNGAGYFLIGTLSIIGIVMIVVTLRKAMGLPIPVALSIAVLLELTKMYAIRYLPFYERYATSSWDRAVGYIVCVLFSIFLTAYGFYCFGTAPDSRVEMRTQGQPEIKVVNDGRAIYDDRIQKVDLDQRGENPKADEKSIGQFFIDLMNLKTHVFFCWFLAIVIEVIILVLTLLAQWRNDDLDPR